MEFINFFFIVLSIIVLGYFLKVFFTDKRSNRGIELIFMGVYFLVMVLFLFPQMLDFIEKSLGIPSAINFFLYLSIFVLFLLVFYLYKKSESQRQEITKLTREFAIKNFKRK